MTRVLVAEDSPTSRALLCAVLDAAPGLEVVGEAENGLEAVRLTQKLRPDVITMDVRMPELDGFEATRRIMAEHPTPVVIVSSLDLADVEAAMSALRVGALAAVAKPVAPSDPEFEARAKALVDTIEGMASVRVVRRRVDPQPHPRRGPRPRAPAFDVVAVAASTGGPAVLHSILTRLPESFEAPMLVVQHMAHGFVEGFAEWLDRSTSMTVKVAERGAALEPRTVYVAPTQQHLGVRNGRIHLDEGPRVEGFCPSASVLFDEVAKGYGPRAVGLILSGMGRDGVDGLVALQRSGGTVVAQSSETCAVFGMPGAAVEAGVVHHVLDPTGIARWLGAEGKRRR